MRFEEFKNVITVIYGILYSLAALLFPIWLIKILIKAIL